MTDDATTLAAERCEACRRDSPRVEPAEAERLLQQLPEWSMVERGGVPRLERAIRFSDYRGVLAFVQRLGELAEAEGHHPVMVVEARKVTVRWWTHAIKALHRNDFVMAAKTDALAIAF
jgi:4a-hydroxytetrahydrobiopterin dehydratase